MCPQPPYFCTSCAIAPRQDIKDPQAPIPHRGVGGVRPIVLGLPPQGNGAVGVAGCVLKIVWP
ncbi:hypothetical protein ACF3NX_04030 [Acetobacter orientalis]|uniref:hypothetical protein n=1 Tax=Acetobacter orientalis TaxID=146474 RepID=UPI003867D99D